MENFIRHPEYSHLILTEIKRNRMGDLIAHGVSNIDEEEMGRAFTVERETRLFFREGSDSVEANNLLDSTIPFFDDASQAEYRKELKKGWGYMAYIPDHYEPLFTH